MSVDTCSLKHPIGIIDYHNRLMSKYSNCHAQFLGDYRRVVAGGTR